MVNSQAGTEKQCADPDLEDGCPVVLHVRCVNACICRLIIRSDKMPDSEKNLVCVCACFLVPPRSI